MIISVRDCFSPVWAECQEWVDNYSEEWGVGLLPTRFVCKSCSVVISNITSKKNLKSRTIRSAVWVTQLSSG